MLNNRRVFLILGLAGLVTFASSLHNGFLVDDHAFFGGQKVTVKSLLYYFIPNKHKLLGIESDATDTSYYRPLAHVVPLISYGLFGNDTFGHHVVNLVLWILAAYLLYLFLLRLSGEMMPAFWTALLFMVHPFNGIAVNYITASIFSTMVIFMLLSVWCVILRPTESVRMMFFGLASVICFYLALMCHETALATPFFAIAALRFGQKQSWKEAFVNSAFLWGALILYYVFRLGAHNVTHGLMHNFIQLNVNPIEYAASLAHTGWWEISKWIYPEGIILMRTEPVQRGAMAILWFLLLCAAGTGSFWVFRRFRESKPMICMGLAWIWIGFIPFICGAAVAPIYGLLIEPHWFMFASIGFFVIVAWAFRGRMVLSSLAIVWLLTAWVYNAVWGDELTYCRQWLYYNPGFKAPLFFLGEAYMERLDYPRALYYWRQSLFHYYKDWFVYVGMGEAYASMGHFQAAKDNFYKALAWEPRSERALGDLAKIYLKEGNWKRAQEFLEHTFETDRFDPAVAVTLGTLYARQGEENKAMFMFSKANELEPCAASVTQPWLGFAITNKDTNSMLALAPPISRCSNDPVSLTMAGSVLGHYGHREEAMAALRRAIAIDANFKDAYVELKKLY